MAEPKAASDSPTSDESIIPSLITDLELRKLFDYWRSKRQGRLMPSKNDIDPIDIGWSLSRIFLLDYGAEDGFRYRLAGDEIARVFGRSNLKGLHLRDVLPAGRSDIVHQMWLPLIEGRCIMCMKGMVYLGADQTPIGERLVLPLADGESDEVTGLLGMTVCEWIVGNVPEEVKLARRQTIPVSAIP